MKKYALLICISCFIVSCTTSEYELARVASPDGKGTAVLVTKERTGIPFPGPEPPRTKARWARLTVTKDGQIKYDTGFEEIGINQRGTFAFDLSWSSDSSLLAYRILNTLRIITKNGKAASLDIVKENALISSFKWLSDNRLLILSKGVDKPLDMFDYPIHYHGYLAKSTYVKVFEFNLDSGLTEHFSQEVRRPTFLFHSIGFENYEISPYSSRVAFSDGDNIFIYDTSRKKKISTAPVAGSIEGIWWANDNTVIVGLGLLSSSKLQFLIFDVISGKVTDKTETLLPLWDRSYKSGDWFRIGIR